MGKKKIVEQPTEQLTVIPLPEGILEAVIQGLLDDNGQIQQLEVTKGTMRNQKDADAIQKMIDRVSIGIKALKESDLSIVKQTGNRYIVDTGQYGYRKITL